MKPLMTLAAVLCLCSSWMAHGESKDPFAVANPAYVGLLAGVSIPDAQGTSVRNSLGLDVGAKLSDEYSVGAFFLNSAKGEDASGGTPAFEFDYSVYGIEGNYNFDGTATGAHFGLRLGTAKVSKQLTVGSQSYGYSPFVWGLQAGYDLMALSHFSIGAELSTLFFQGGSTDATTGLSVGAFDSWNFMLVGKFWL